MNKPTTRNQTFKFCLCLLFLISGLTNAQVQEPFSLRFSESLKGDVTIIANNMLSRDFEDNYDSNNGNHDYNNNVYVDIDNDDSTFNSSSANFSNPELNVACISIYRAYLYWAAADKEQDNGNENQSNWNFNDIKLMLPGETAYTTMTADDVIFRGRDTHFSNEPYICFKDITSQVMTLPDKYGKYQVANVEAKTGSVYSHDGDNIGTSGGWQIVFIYESFELPSRNISIFDGYAHVTQSTNNFDINFDGFQTIPTGNVDANIVIGALEGDRDLFGDRLQILDATNNFVDIMAPQRDADNFFNSRITVGNNNFIDRNPASTNTLGFDAAVFRLDNPGNSIITNNQTNATLRLTSDQETYGLYLLGLSVEIWEPNFNPMLLSQNSGNNPADPGAVLGFNLNVHNIGNDDAENVTLSTILPHQVTLTSVLNLQNGITYTYDNLTNELIFNLEDGLGNVNAPELNIEFELTINDACYFLEDDCDLFADLQFIATYNGVINPDEQTTLSTSDINSCTALPLTIDLNQPTVDWLTSPGELDTTVSCEDSDAINAALSLEPVPDKCNFTLSKTSGPFIQGSCPSEGTYTNIWNFTDACGNTISDYVQTITVVDNTNPTASNPASISVQCIDDVPLNDISVVTDAADNCSTPIVAFISDVTDGLTCPETITRTYSVTDSCNNTIYVTQAILINDEVAPEIVTPLENEINITCEEVPDIPNLEFTDNCTTNLEIDFNESTTIIDDLSFDIIRTWRVTDECNNESQFIQNIHVNRMAESNTQYLYLCIDDDPIDLYSLIPYIDEINNINSFSDEWDSDYMGLLRRYTLNPATTEQGDYVFTHTYSHNDCVFTTFINININDDCVYYPCIDGEENIDITKLVTPNNDGFNDYFTVSYNLNEDSNEICDITIDVKIFNRWGTRIFHSGNYQNNWNGHSPGSSMGSSENLPTGTYFYVVEFKNSGLKPIQGYIYLRTE